MSGTSRQGNYPESSGYRRATGTLAVPGIDTALPPHEPPGSGSSIPENYRNETVSTECINLMPPQQPASQPTSTVWKYPVRTTGQSVSPAGIGWNDQEMVPLDQYGIQEPRGKKTQSERTTYD